jgi:hypothetical protein
MSQLRALRFPFLLLVTYAWLFAWFPGLRSPNELSRLFQARAIATDHVLAIDLQVARHGSVGDIALKDGRHYAAKAPGVSLLGAPIFAAVAHLRGGEPLVSERAGVFFLRIFLCVPAGVLAAVLLRRILARIVDPDLAIAGSTVFALGTLMWPYSTQLVGHGPTAAALVASWYALDRRRDAPEAMWPMLAGFAAGCAVLMEYTSALALPALAGYGFATATRPARAAALAAAGAALPLTVLALFHLAAFGNPLVTPYSHLASPLYAEWHGRGFMGLEAPGFRLLAVSFLDPARGLFTYAPFLALGLPGLAWLWRSDRATAGLCAGALALYGLFTSGFSLPAWGWSIGPRHLTPLCAFLVPPAMAMAANLRARGLGFLPAGLAAYSILVMALVCAVCPYFPEELTNPVAQLVAPLARDGYHVADLLGMATGVHSYWTLLPWAMSVALLALPALAALAGGSGARGRALQVSLTVLLAIVMIGGLASLGGSDRFEGTRAFIRSQYEFAARTTVPGVFAPP